METIIFKETVEIEHEATEKDDKIALGSKVKLSVPSGQEAFKELVVGRDQALRKANER